MSRVVSDPVGLEHWHSQSFKGALTPSKHLLLYQWKCPALLLADRLPSASFLFSFFFFFFFCSIEKKFCLRGNMRRQLRGSYWSNYFQWFIYLRITQHQLIFVFHSSSWNWCFTLDVLCPFCPLWPWGECKVTSSHVDSYLAVDWSLMRYHSPSKGKPVAPTQDLIRSK